MELYYGALNKADLRGIKKYLEAFEIIHINHEISQLGIDLVEKYAKSHNLNLPDALIGAAAITYDMELYTLNLKDFRYIEGLKLWRV
jgi:predicted nucleic acid-binding protein